MMKKTACLPVKEDDPEQSALFMQKAREIGADEKRSAADMLMGQMAKTPPQPKKKTKRT